MTVAINATFPIKISFLPDLKIFRYYLHGNELLFNINDKLPLHRSINLNCFLNPLLFSKVSKVKVEAANDQEMGKG